MTAVAGWLVPGFQRPVSRTGSTLDEPHIHNSVAQVQDTKSEICLINCYNVKNQPSIYLSVNAQ